MQIVHQRHHLAIHPGNWWQLKSPFSPLSQIKLPKRQPNWKTHKASLPMRQTRTSPRGGLPAPGLKTRNQNCLQRQNHKDVFAWSYKFFSLYWRWGEKIFNFRFIAIFLPYSPPHTYLWAGILGSQPRPSLKTWVLCSILYYKGLPFMYTFNKLFPSTH